MNNYFYPGFTSMWQNPNGISAIGNVAKKGINWSGIINGVQKTLNIANQAIPVFNQIRPMWNNARTLFKVFGEFNKMTRNEKTPQKTTFNTQKKEIETEKRIIQKNNGKPQFFL